MIKCPKCGRMYSELVKTCPVCKVDLNNVVEKLPNYTSSTFENVKQSKVVPDKQTDSTEIRESSNQRPIWEKIKNVLFYVFAFVLFALAKAIGKAAVHNPFGRMALWGAIINGIIGGCILSLIIFKSKRFKDPKSASVKYTIAMAVAGAIGGAILAIPVAVILIIYIFFIKKNEL